MEIRSILVDIGALQPAPILTAAVELAKRLGAKLVGFAAAEPSAQTVVVEGGAVVTTWYEKERAAIESSLQGLEEHFVTHTPPELRLGWRGYITNPTQALIDTSRSADLIITSSSRVDGQADLGEVSLRSGRPLLAIADDSDRINTDTVVIAWKDTRESRRAVSDALPLLHMAKDVVVATALEGDQGLARAGLVDVAHWLRLHDVKAREEVIPVAGTAGNALISTASSMDADLIVSGAYGHSRFREWLLGGVTNELLETTTISRFFSN